MYPYMAEQNLRPVDKTVERHLLDKRDEIMWALKFQDYKNAEIARIFNVHRSLVNQVVRRMPEGWVPKWRKVQE